jgi:hypothetical protein
MKKLAILVLFICQFAFADTITHISGSYAANTDGAIALTADFAEGWQLQFAAFLTSGTPVANCVSALLQCTLGETLNAGFSANGSTLSALNHTFDGNIDVVGLFTLPANANTGDVFTITVPLTWTSNLKLCANSVTCGAPGVPSTSLLGSGTGTATFSVLVVAPFANHPEQQFVRILQGGSISLDNTVPEPATALLVGSGLLALARKRRSAA